MNSLLASTVPDPTDFPSHAIVPGIRGLDSSLRCTICVELFDGPVTLPCGHCFCSLCIRTSMSVKQECPLCRKAANEGHIRPNPAMEEVVAAWNLSRPSILRLSKDEESRQTFQIATPRHKKRKLSPGSGMTNIIESPASGNSTSAPLSPSKPTNRRQRRTSSDNVFGPTVPTSDIDEDEMHPGTNLNPLPEDVVKCPLCNKAVKYKDINGHIDKGCPSTPTDPPRSSKSEWSKIMAPKSGKAKEKDTSDPDDGFPLPKVSYDTLKEKKLKEMLLDQKLPTNGDRSLMIKRHQQWVTIYNANLDKSAANRKTKSELRRDLKKWEEERIKQKRSSVVDDLVAYERHHKDEFAQLIDAARRAKVTKSKTIPPLSEATRTSSSSGSSSNGTAPPSHGQQKFTSQLSCDEEAIVIDSEEELEMK